jgi:hypothetical protein
MKKFQFLLSVFLFAATSPLYAAGGLMVTPNRLDFKDNVDSQEVKLINKSEEPVTYRVSLQHLRMDEKGNYKEILVTETDAPEKFADDLLRYSPRRVTLQPNEVQTIRVMVKKPADLPAGEYRSHFLFREEPAPDLKPDGNVEAPTKKKDGKISVTLKPLFGISIPALVSNGDVKGESAIENMVIKTDEKEHRKLLSLDITRAGNGSVYGNILVTFKSNKTSKEYDIGVLNSVAVFYPYAKRNVLINLNIPKDIKLSDGVLNAQYIAKPSDSDWFDTKKVLSQNSLIIN